jgi:hypothetical protein
MCVIQFCWVAVQVGEIFAAPPEVVLQPSKVGLNVPLDDNLQSVTYGADQFLGSGFATDGIAARTLDDASLPRFARYGTTLFGQGATALSPDEDWAIEIAYKHTGDYGASQNPFFIQHREDDTRVLALFPSSGSDNWSLGAGNATGSYTMVATDLELEERWNRFHFHYRADSQTIDAYLNKQLIAPGIALGHGRYDPNQIQLEYTGAGTDWFGEVKMGGAQPRSRSQNFGNEWVWNQPFTLQALVTRSSSLADPRYRDANFTNVLAWENEAAIIDNAVEEQGLPWHWHTDTRTLSSSLMDDLDNYLQNYPGGEAVLVWDEPRRTDFQHVGQVTDWIKQNHPELMVYGNLSTFLTPGNNYGYEYGTTFVPGVGYEDPPVPYDYATFADDYLHVVQPDVLQFGVYPFRDSQTLPTDDYLNVRYYRGLAAVREAGLRADVPYFVFVQSFDGGDTYHPSESEMRMQVFASLAHGFKGISYFMFGHYDGGDGGLLGFTDASESSYTTNPIYGYARDTNTEVARLGETLKMLTSTQVRFLPGKHMQGPSEVANTLPQGVTQWNAVTDDPFITSIEAANTGAVSGITEGDLLIGHFVPSLEGLDGDQFTDESYFMVVNLLKDQHASAAGAAQQITVDFDFGASGINSLQRLNRNTGEIEVVPLTPMGGSLYQLDFDLPGGTGDLFKYNTGASFVHGLSLERTWDVHASGAWEIGHNWTGGVPDGNAIDAKLGDAIQRSETVVTGEDVTLRSLTFDSPHSYTVDGSGTIKLEHADAATGERSGITVSQGDHEFQARVKLVNDTDLSVVAGAQVTFEDALRLQGNTLHKTGPGTMAVNSHFNYGFGTVHVTEGILAGSGRIRGNVTNEGGILSPGSGIFSSASSSTDLVLSGGGAQADSSVLLMETTAAGEQGLLAVGQLSGADGHLRIDLLENFQPASGNVFHVAGFQAGTDQFETIALPSLAGQLQWDVSQLYASATVSVVQVPEPHSALGMWLGLVFVVQFVMLDRPLTRIEVDPKS